MALLVWVAIPQQQQGAVRPQSLPDLSQLTCLPDCRAAVPGANRYEV